MELDKDDKGRMHTQLELWKSCTTSAIQAPSPLCCGQHSLPPCLPTCPRLTSGAGIAQGAADFTLVQVRPRDHEDVGDLAQGAVVRGLAPHLLGGQRAALQ